jgi:predicted dinucleotide-binding enzyme
LFDDHQRLILYDEHRTKPQGAAVNTTRRVGAERRSVSATVANYIHELSERHNGGGGTSTEPLPSNQPKESDVRIGIIGSGRIGATAARLFVDAGHEVAIANSRGPQSLGDVVDGLGPRAHPADTLDAAAFGEVVLVAIPFGRYRELPAESLAEATVIDAMNYYPRRDGNYPELDADETTSSELLAAHLPGTRVVKAFNTMVWSTLRDRGSSGPRDERLALFIAGDDPDAKDQVTGLIEEIGFAAVDTGGLADGGRLQQMGSPLIRRDVTAREAEQLLTSGVRKDAS